ncbi:hypothetical protein GQ457_03G041810 [Hibiscus cannabinus]
MSSESVYYVQYLSSPSNWSCYQSFILTYLSVGRSPFLPILFWQLYVTNTCSCCIQFKNIIVAGRVAFSCLNVRFFLWLDFLMKLVRKF